MLCEISFYVSIRIPTFQDTKHSYHLNSPFVSFSKSLSRNHFFWTSYRWNHTICIFFWFISLNIFSLNICFSIQPVVVLYQYLSFVWVISHLCIYHPNLLNYSSDNEYLNISKVFKNVQWKHCTHFPVDMFLFFLHKYLRVELFGGEVEVEFHMKLLKVFPQYLSLLILQSPHILTNFDIVYLTYSLVLSVFF